jgi:hypothetical protein
MVVRRVVGDQWSIGALTRMRWSPGGVTPGWARSSSNRAPRMRRRIRFRATAFPTERGIANAIRGEAEESVDVSNRETSRIGPLPTRTPSRRSRAKSSRPASRPITPTTGRGPCVDASARWHVRHGCSCGNGTRASSPACARWADTAASCCSSAYRGQESAPRELRLPRWGTDDVNPSRYGGMRWSATTEPKDPKTLSGRSERGPTNDGAVI